MKKVIIKIVGYLTELLLKFMPKNDKLKHFFVGSTIMNICLLIDIKEFERIALVCLLAALIKEVYDLIDFKIKNTQKTYIAYSIGAVLDVFYTVLPTVTLILI
jgi:hypothetical protein